MFIMQELSELWAILRAPAMMIDKNKISHGELHDGDCLATTGRGVLQV
jgi:hypothetical protein